MRRRTGLGRAGGASRVATALATVAASLCLLAGRSAGAEPRDPAAAEWLFREGRALMKKLKVYAGETHPHTAQKPAAMAATT